MVSYRQNTDILHGYRVDDRQRKVPNTKAAFLLQPGCTKQGVLQQQLDRPFELGKKRLGQNGSGALPVILGGFAKVGFRGWMQRILH